MDGGCGDCGGDAGELAGSISVSNGDGERCVSRCLADIWDEQSDAGELVTISDFDLVGEDKPEGVVYDLADGVYAGHDGDGTGFAGSAAGVEMDWIVATPCQTRCYNQRDLWDCFAGIVCYAGGGDGFDLGKTKQPESVNHSGYRGLPPPG